MPGCHARAGGGRGRVAHHQAPKPVPACLGTFLLHPTVSPLQNAPLPTPHTQVEVPEGLEHLGLISFKLHQTLVLPGCHIVLSVGGRRSHFAAFPQKRRGRGRDAWPCLPLMTCRHLVLRHGL